MPTPPYDQINTIMNTARVRLNDRVETLYAVSGKVLENTQTFSQQAVNSAWRKFQEFLAKWGYTGLNQEVDLIGVPATGSTDPISQAFISYINYWDGAAFHAQPTLPQNCIRPWKLWERTSGSGANLTEMDPIMWGLPAVPKANWNRQWEWRDDIIYLPGALQSTDIRIRYSARIADFMDFVPDSTQPWYNQLAQIMFCEDPLADYIAREISIARADTDGAALFQASAEANAMMLIDRDTGQGKATQNFAQLGRMRDKYTGDNPQPIKRG